MPRLLTVAEAAAEIGVSKAKVWQWISSGRIGSVKVDGARRLRPDHIDTFVASFADERPQQSRKAKASA
jgi:excisionase family DNA binding protein